MDILKPSTTRYVMFPIQYQDLYEWYKKHVACFWTPEEVSLANDMQGWMRLKEEERTFILQILGFFAASDGLVIQNLMENFISEVQVPEAIAFYSFQNAMENIHSQQYSLLIEHFQPDFDKRMALFKTIDNHASTKAKAEWVMQRMKRTDGSVTDFSKRLIAFAAVEGIMFSSSFCALFWLKTLEMQCPGLSMSNEFIARDEGMHRDFACCLYKYFPKLPETDVYEIIDSAVVLEKAFVDEILPQKLTRMDSRKMKEYVMYVADHLLVSLGYRKKYNIALPFDFMNTISLNGKTNFFERRVSEYAKAEHSSFNLDSDF
jgi:ribonucleotide reductase beta subunit family protein with ferritin-like domain